MDKTMTKLLTVSFFGSKNAVGGSENFFDQFNNIYPSEHVDFQRAIKTLHGEVGVKPHDLGFFEVEGGIMIDQYLLERCKLFKPDLIIRNSWSGGLIRIPAPQIAVYQDIHHTAAKILFEMGYYNPIDYNRIAIAWVHLQKMVEAQAKVTVAVSHYTKEKLEEAGIRIDKVIPHGVDLDEFKPITDKKQIEQTKKQWNIPLDKKIGLWIGRLHPQKGWHIVRDLIIKHPEIHWIVMFSQNIDRKPRLPNVTILDTYPRMVMPTIYNMCDFYVMASCVESFSLTTLEAMACNKPVIGYETGLLWDLTHNKETWTSGEGNLFVCTGWNVESFEIMLELSLKYKGDTNTRKIAELYPIQKWEEEWKEIIDEVIKNENTNIPNKG